MIGLEAIRAVPVARNEHILSAKSTKHQAASAGFSQPLKKFKATAHGNCFSYQQLRSRVLQNRNASGQHLVVGVVGLVLVELTRDFGLPVSAHRRQSQCVAA